MLRGLWNASAGMRAQQQKIDVTANNIANVNTVGYKKKNTVFQDLVYQSIERRGNAVAPAGAGAPPSSVGAGSAVAGIRADLRPGSYVHSGRALDLAIVGDGYFQVTLPDGQTGYTRAGTFTLDGSGGIVTDHGYRVAFPQLPQGDYELLVSSEGLVSAVYPDEEPVALGTISLAYFANPQGLTNVGDNVLLATEASGVAENAVPGESTRLMQGYFESSNVDLSEEMVKLVTSQRAFELNSRALRTSDEMWSIANQIRR